MDTALFINYYTADRQERQDEIRFCIDSNIQNPSLDYIYIITYDIDEYIDTISNNPKVRIIHIFDDIHLSYYDFFKLATDNAPSHDINIFANIDIVFDQTVEHCKPLINNFELGCISRLELSSDKIWKPINNPHQSHDAWVLNGVSLNKLDFRLMDELSNIKLGTPRCEMKMAALFYTYNWNLKNICNMVNIKHIHKFGQSRTYSVFNTDNIGLNAEVYPVNNYNENSNINLLCSTVRTDNKIPNMLYTNWIGANIKAAHALDQIQTYPQYYQLYIKNRNTIQIDTNNIYCFEIMSNSYFRLFVEETGQKMIICPGRNIQYLHSRLPYVTLLIEVDDDSDNHALLISHFHRKPQI